MGQQLSDIAKQLKNSTQKVQLIYAFNGVGKTRLSREFKELIAPKIADAEEQEDSGHKILYYNAFTEDLFYWDNDLDADSIRKLKIQSNNFTNWILKEQGQEQNIITNFQHYTSNKLTPRFNEKFDEITFSIATGNDVKIDNIKLSKGEESNLIWCIFYSLLEQIIEILKNPDPDERDNRAFNKLEYVFIDDPVSSLDDNHLIELAVDLANLVKEQNDLKFIITTHNPLFYNVLYNEFNNSDKEKGYKKKRFSKKRLEKLEDGSFILEDSKDSPFSYHLFLLNELDKAVKSKDIKKYHFKFLRHILEKTSTFLGYSKWEELLPNETEGAQKEYYKRIINLSNHAKHSGEESSIIQDNDKKVLEYLLYRVIIPTYHFNIDNINEHETI